MFIFFPSFFLCSCVWGGSGFVERLFFWLFWNFHSCAKSSCIWSRQFIKLYTVIWSQGIKSQDGNGALVKRIEKVYKEPWDETAEQRMLFLQSPAFLPFEKPAPVETNKKPKDSKPPKPKSGQVAVWKSYHLDSWVKC